MTRKVQFGENGIVVFDRKDIIANQQRRLTTGAAKG